MRLLIAFVCSRGYEKGEVGEYSRVKQIFLYALETQYLDLAMSIVVDAVHDYRHREVSSSVSNGST